MESVDARDFLRAFPSARELSQDALQHLLSACMESRIEADQLLFDAGDMPDCVYLVLHGTLRMERVLEGGQRVPLGRAKRGHIVGEMGLLDGQVRGASAVAEIETTVLRVDAEDYRAMKAAGHPVALWLLGVVHRRMSARISRTYERITRLEQEPGLAARLPEERVLATGFLERWMRRLRRES